MIIQKQKEIQVIAITGYTNCGSTLLNLILDTHPKIHGCGELLYLLINQERGVNFNLVCTSCMEKCSIWTPERINNIPRNNFYHDIYSYSNAEIIVDSSKYIKWYLEREAEESGINMNYVILVKHPVRHITSTYLNGIIYNIEEKKDIRYDCDLLYREYFEAIDQLEKNNKSFITIRYEDIVQNMKESINSILKPFSLSYIPEMEYYHKHKHHQLVGNNGTLFICENKWSPWSPEEKLHSIRRKQYEKNKEKGIFFDNKYKNVLTPDQIQIIQETPKIKEFMGRFGYKPLT